MSPLEDPDVLRQAIAVLENWLPPRGRIALGAGRTVEALLPYLAPVFAVRKELVVVSASERTSVQAATVGLPVAWLDSAPCEEVLAADDLDLLLDGADEVDPQLNLIKGYGGALTREKILAGAAQRRIYVVTPEKLVPVLGTRGRLPLEVMRFGWHWTKRHVEAALATVAELRRDADGQPVVTDNGQYLLDCRIGPVAQPAELQRRLRAIPGVVEVGLFLNLADEVLVLKHHGIRLLSRAVNHSDNS